MWINHPAHRRWIASPGACCGLVLRGAVANSYAGEQARVGSTAHHVGAPGPFQVSTELERHRPPLFGQWREGERARGADVVEPPADRSPEERGVEQLELRSDPGARRDRANA